LTPKGQYNLDSEKYISYQRKPLHNKIHTQINNQDNKAVINSLEAAVEDIIFLGKVAG
jgi:hypothetical protein